MKCIECGYENKDGSRFCNYCGAAQVKIPAVSNTGSALRKIYNDFGYEKVFEDSRYITSALSDMLPDSDILCSSIEHAYRVGLGKLYESQVRSGNNPDAGFYLTVSKLITEDAGFSEKKAKELIKIFDEMLGWKTEDVPESVVIPKHEIGTAKQGTYEEAEKLGTTKPTSAEKETLPEAKITNKKKKSLIEFYNDYKKGITIGTVIIAVVMIALVIIDSVSISNKEACNGISNYLKSRYYSNPSSYINIDGEKSNLLEAVVFFDIGNYYYHINRLTGDTYCTTYSISTKKEERSNESFNIKEYLK